MGEDRCGDGPAEDLTKRQYAAVQFMAAMVHRAGGCRHSDDPAQSRAAMASEAVALADALFAKLEGGAT